MTSLLSWPVSAGRAVGEDRASRLTERVLPRRWTRSFPADGGRPARRRGGDATASRGGRQRGGRNAWSAAHSRTLLRAADSAAAHHQNPTVFSYGVTQVDAPDGPRRARTSRTTHHGG